MRGMNRGGLRGRGRGGIMRGALSLRGVYPRTRITSDSYCKLEAASTLEELGRDQREQMTFGSSTNVDYNSGDANRAERPAV